MSGDGVVFAQGSETVPALPLKILVVAELGSRDLASGSAATTGARVRIDRLTFDAVFATLAPGLTLDVRDRLSDSREPMIVTLRFEGLRSLGPDAIVDQLPAARDLVRLRSAMSELREAKIGLAELKSLIASLKNRSKVLESVGRALEPPAAPAAPATPSPAGDLDALLDLVETPAHSARGGAGADIPRLDALIRTLVRSPERERVDGRAVDAAIAEIDAALGSQVDEVVHHPEFRRLEATWRGLKLLVDRVDFEQPITVELLVADRQGMLERFDALVYGPESATVVREPVSFVVLDFEFDRGPADLELLEALSERAAILSTPVLSAIGPRFFALDRASEMEGLPGLRQEFAAPAFIKWKGLRESEHSRWLGMITNRFLLRREYGPEGSAARTFGYVESLSAGHGDDFRLWGSPVWAVASLAARSFARLGWCTDMMGQRAAGAIQDLPVRTVDRKGAGPAAHALEILVTDEQERDLSENGLMALTSAPSSDKAYLRFAPTVHVPAHYPDPADKARAKLQSTVPFQMFVGRVVQYIVALQAFSAGGVSTEQVVQTYDRALRGLLATAGPVPQDALAVEVLQSDDDPSASDLHVRIRWPGGQSLPGAGEFEIRFPLAG